MGCWTYEEPRSQFTDWESAVLPNDHKRWDDLRDEIVNDDARLDAAIKAKGLDGISDTTSEEDWLVAGELAYLQIMEEDKAVAAAEAITAEPETVGV